MKLDLIKPALVLLCVFFAVMWLMKSCDKPTVPPQDQTEWRTVVNDLKAQVAARDTIIKAIRGKRAKDSIENLSALKATQMREAALVRKLKQANADIQQIADSLPKVARYIDLADSTISIKDVKYAQEVSRRIADELSFRSEIAELAGKNVQQVKISEELTTVVTDLTNQNAKLAKRLERKKRGNRLLLGVAAGLGAAIAVMTLTQ